MIYSEKTIHLKNGQPAILRAPRAEDAAEILAYLQRACGETDFLARYPEEMRFTCEQETAYLQNTLKNPNGMMIVCTVDGVIAGNCEIVFLNTQKTMHRANVMIGLLQEYWGLGIGSAMFSELIEAARSRGGIRQLELEMIEGNTRAMALYRKMGFTVVSEFPDAYLRKDGSYAKAIYMRKILEPADV